MKKKKRAMIDTNILFSACFYSSEITVSLFDALYKNNFEIALTKDIIEEIYDVVKRKQNDNRKAVDEFLADLNYTLIPSPEDYTDIPRIRDEKDKPILAAAIASDVDYFITGDKDFLVLDIKKPKILTMKEFVKKFSI